MRNLILILSLIFSHYIYGQTDEIINSYKTTDNRIIKLLPNNRVLLEVEEKLPYTNRINKITKTDDGKIIAAPLPIYSIIHSSYGTYNIRNNKLILTFKNENPIEKIEIDKNSDKKLNKDENRIKITKNFETYYSLKVFQNEKQLCSILPFGDKCKFALENIKEPLVFNYNEHTKKILIPSKKNIVINVVINDLKGHNYINKNKLIYNFNDLVKKNKR